MRTYLAAALAAAFALSFVPSASATHVFQCEPDVQIVCDVSDLSERVLCGRWITC